jgi:hypothetical protein
MSPQWCVHGPVIRSVPSLVRIEENVVPVEVLDVPDKHHHDPSNIIKYNDKYYLWYTQHPERTNGWEGHIRWAHHRFFVALDFPTFAEVGEDVVVGFWVARGFEILGVPVEPAAGPEGRVG